MASLLEQLDRESMLWLYLAEELPVEERAEVERRLAGDAALAGELERIRQMRDAARAQLAAVDAAAPLPMGCETAVRRASRAMKQWQVDRAGKPPAAGPARHPFHVPWWGYAAGVAAAMIVGVVIWSSNIPDATQLSAEEIQQRQVDVANALEIQWGTSADREMELAYAGNALPASSSSTDELMDEIFMRADQR